MKVLTPALPGGASTLEIEENRDDAPVRVSPDLPVCDDCLAEMFDRYDRRYWYPYINCANCGPRYSIVLSLPYDRATTTMRAWPMCPECRREYEDPKNRRFQAHPTACPRCGPSYALIHGRRVRHANAAIEDTVALVRAGGIVAVKGIGGYHLTCDARDAEAVGRLRARKFRKDHPFPVMVRDLDAARTLVSLDDAQIAALSSRERPILLAAARVHLDDVAPDDSELGVMLPYTPMHHLLFAAGAPDAMVVTSANRPGEPIAHHDEDAVRSLSGIADAFLMGDRPIARRMDDSVVRVSVGIPTILRRSRGLAPAALAKLPAAGPILALGGDRENAIALAVDGHVLGSQHIGDVEHPSVRGALRDTIKDLCSMYGVQTGDLTIAHDLNTGCYTAELAATLHGARRIGVQHHRAHVASVIAEREAWSIPVLAFAFDGGGYGDDGKLWGGEIFTGTLGNLQRTGHLRPIVLPDGVETTSVGRLFDAVSTLLGGQGAAWLEHLAWRSPAVDGYAFAVPDDELDYRPVLERVVADRLAGRDVAEIAYAFHRAVASAVLCVAQGWSGPVVVSGAVFANRLLCAMLSDELGARLWRNHSVPPNDGGIALGQAAIAGFLLGF